MTFLEGNGRNAEAIPFLEELIREYPDQPMYRRALAAQLHRLGRTTDAVEHLDALGETVAAGRPEGRGVEVITQIIAMNPPNVRRVPQVACRRSAA